MALVPIYRKEIEITSEYLDEMNHVNNVWHVQWMQDVAIQHSTINGWGTQRYLDLGAAWFVRRHTVNYLLPILKGDTVVVETWVSEMKHVSSVRRYRFFRKSDGAMLAEAETKWGLVNLATGRPAKAPAELLDCFVQLQKAG
ncbi:MAG: acyl-CoA thioesterase [Planctomycetia bacterium]|nr:acyl-CoA thioesterase [Planctomycetia bacterium]